MEYRLLGNTGLIVSEIGFGSWAIGGDEWGAVKDNESIDAINKAIDLGVNFIDTADVYGLGHSETLVAKAINKRRQDIILSTKGGLIGHHYDPSQPAVYGDPKKIIDASLLRLKTDYIDVYFCHIWWDKHEETDAFLQAFQTLNKVEKLRSLVRSNRSLAQVALRYVLSHPAVSVAIPGAKNSNQVEENSSHLTRPLLLDNEIEFIKKL